MNKQIISIISSVLLRAAVTRAAKWAVNHNSI